MYTYDLDGLEEKILEGFSYVYRANTGFLTLENPYRQRCFEAIRDPELMSHIIFNNDYLKIPPVYTFLCYYVDQEPGLEPVDDPWLKKSVGAFWGYVFRKVFKYDNSHNTLLPGKKLKFRSASYFTRD